MIDPVESKLSHIVHFRLSDGSIVGKVSALDYAHTPINDEPGLDYIEYTGPEEFRVIHWDTHKVDLATRMIVEKTEEQKRLALLPTSAQITCLIERELLASDKTQIPDYPIDAAARKAWATYRQALRDFSKMTGAALPARPDGSIAET